MVEFEAVSINGKRKHTKSRWNTTIITVADRLHQKMIKLVDESWRRYKVCIISKSLHQGRRGSYCWMSIKFQSCKIKKIPEMDGGDVVVQEIECTSYHWTVHLIPLRWYISCYVHFTIKFKKSSSRYLLITKEKTVILQQTHLAETPFTMWQRSACLLYTSDAADDYLEV